MELLAAVVRGEEIRANWIWIETTKEEGNIVYFSFFFLRERAVLLLLLELGTGFSWSPVSEPKNKKPRLTEQALGLGLPLEFQVVGYDYPTRLSRWDRFHLILLDILHFCTEAVFRVSCKSC